MCVFTISFFADGGIKVSTCSVIPQTVELHRHTPFSQCSISVKVVVVSGPAIYPFIRITLLVLNTVKLNEINVYVDYSGF